MISRTTLAGTFFGMTSIGTGETAKTVDIWCAQVHARAGHPDVVMDICSCRRLALVGAV